MLFTPSGNTEIEGEGPHLRRALTHFEQKDTSGHGLRGLINMAQYSSFEPLGKNACLL